MLFQGTSAVSLALAGVRGTLHVLPAGTPLLGLTRGEGMTEPSLPKRSLFLCSLLSPEPLLLSGQPKVPLRSLALDAASKITSETQEHVPSNGTKM